MDKNYVTAAKPAAGGGIWVGPTTATLPTNARTAPGEDFTSLGAVSSDGVKRNVSLSNTPVIAWGGATVAILDNSKTETFAFTLIEPTNIDVLGLAFSKATGDLTEGITVVSNADQRKEHAYVISTILADGILQKIVIPRGVVTAVGEVSYVDGVVISFPLTITAIGEVYEYLASPAAEEGETPAEEGETP